MNCNQLRNELEALDLRVDGLSLRFRRHLTDCDLCRHWLQDRRLASALCTPVPAPSADFENRVLGAAAAAHAGPTGTRASGWPGWRQAAASVLVLLLAVTVVLSGWRNRDPDAPASPDAPQVVNVVIDAQDNRPGALLTVELPEELELDGFSGRRVIEWHTDLAKGKNLLALPVRSRTGAGGDIQVALSYQGTTAARMRIPVDVP